MRPLSIYEFMPMRNRQHGEIDMSRIAKIAIAATIALGSFGAGGAAWAQQLNGQQALQFLTSKSTLQTSGGAIESWKPNGTYSGRRGGSSYSGTYSVDGNGQVCFRGRTGFSGCYVIVRDAHGYAGRGVSGGSAGRSWRYQ
jgi:hypothetical protein